MAPPQKTYLFYDIETTGLNPCFDQVLQFAAIRTDLELQEIARYEIFVKPNCDVVPAPEAMITHRITLEACQSGDKEVDAIQKIHHLLNTPGTISIGYNTLGFDDEFLRFSFYRNLFAPYTHQYAKSCSRMDIYPMILMYYLFKPETLKWPMVDGRISLKLENLNKENQLSKGQAHNAMVDVEVTLALAKKLIKERETWDYLTQYFVKRTDTERVMKLPTTFRSKNAGHQLALAVSGKLGSKNNFLAPVLSLGQHHHYKNQNLWLRLDDAALKKITKENIANSSFVIRKKIGEAPFILPYQDRFVEKLKTKQKDLAQENLAWLQEQEDLFQDICNYHQEYKYPEVPNIDADAALYEVGFPSTQEENLFRDFHQAKPEKKSEIMAYFPNLIRKEQALRILGRHYPECLSEDDRAAFETYRQSSTQGDTGVDYRGKTKLSVSEALKRIASLKETATLDDEQKDCLAKLEEGLKSQPA